MDKNTKLIMDEETGFYKYPDPPEGLIPEEKLPKKYTVKKYTKKEREDFAYQQSIRGYSLTRMSKGKVNVLIDGKLETKQGWIPGTSGLAFRCLAIGLVKLDGWIVVERNIGISLMPEVPVEEPKPLKPGEAIQLDLFNTEPEPVEVKKQVARTRDAAIITANQNVLSFIDTDWMQLQEKLNYELAGIDFDYVRDPEQQKLADEYSERIAEVNDANDLITKTKNFYATYKNLRVYEHSKDRPKMTRKKNGVRIVEKPNTRKKTKFFASQEDYGNALEVEGIILPVDIDDVGEIKDIIIVKGDKFKDTPIKELYSPSKYYAFEPYMGLGVGFSGKTLKETINNVLDFFTSRVEKADTDKLNKRVKLHNEKILAAQSGEDISKYLQE